MQMAELGRVSPLQQREGTELKRKWNSKVLVSGFSQVVAGGRADGRGKE